MRTMGGAFFDTCRSEPRVATSSCRQASSSGSPFGSPERALGAAAEAGAVVGSSHSEGLHSARAELAGSGTTGSTRGVDAPLGAIGGAEATTGGGPPTGPGAATGGGAERGVPPTGGGADSGVPPTGGGAENDDDARGADATGGGALSGELAGGGAL